MVVSNPHLSLVYELYYKAFERFRVIPEICSLDDNDRFCDVLKEMLKEHLVVIPNLATGVLECRELFPPDEMDRFMNTLLRAVCKQTPILSWLGGDINTDVLYSGSRGSLVVLLQSNT